MQKEKLFYSFVILSDTKDKIDTIEKSLRDLHQQNILIQSYENKQDLLCNLKIFSVYTIYLLDIHHDIEILNLGKQIQEDNPNCAIIFFSEFLEDALRVFEIKSCYFIYFKEWDNYIEPAIHKAEMLMIESQHKLSLFMKDKTLLIPLEEIRYLERVKRMTYIYASDLYHDARNLDYHLNNLNWYFIQCHRSFIVNLSYVREYHRDKFILHDGSEIPISRPFSKNVKLAFEQYLTVC